MGRCLVFGMVLGFLWDGGIVPPVCHVLGREFVRRGLVEYEQYDMSRTSSIDLVCI
jgi:hypothetical protein